MDLVLHGKMLLESIIYKNKEFRKMLAAKRLMKHTRANECLGINEIANFQKCTHHT